MTQWHCGTMPCGGRVWQGPALTPLGRGPAPASSCWPGAAAQAGPGMCRAAPACPLPCPVPGANPRRGRAPAPWHFPGGQAQALGRGLPPGSAACMCFSLLALACPRDPPDTCASLCRGAHQGCTEGHNSEFDGSVLSLNPCPGGVGVCPQGMQMPWLAEAACSNWPMFSEATWQSPQITLCLLQVRRQPLCWQHSYRHEAAPDR